MHRGQRRGEAASDIGGGGRQMRVLRHVGGLHPGVHRPRPRQVRREVDMRAVLRGGEGGGREERREKRGGCQHPHERLLQVQQVRSCLPGSVPSGSHERDVEEDEGRSERSQSQQNLQR